ncbi:MAG: metal-dependent hydrolase [Patescibacteria group bacterium]
MINQAHFSYPFLLALLIAMLIGHSFTLGEVFVILTASVFPDVDFLFGMWSEFKHPEKKESHHAYITHAPLVYVPIIIVLMVIEMKLGLLVMYGLLTHFIMDSLVAPDGIRWLYPFKDKFYLWTKITKDLYGFAFLNKYRSLRLYTVDNIAFLVTVVIVVYMITT